MSNIIKLAPEAADADDILEDAKGSFKELIIIGWDKEGDFLRALTSSTLSSADTLYLMKLFEAALLDSALRDS
tara:strand:+ start:262 stop:480 length:219 start_codon:yes stop_codon:yes gene_type:complete